MGLCGKVQLLSTYVCVQCQSRNVLIHTIHCTHLNIAISSLEMIFQEMPVTSIVEQIPFMLFFIYSPFLEGALTLRKRDCAEV